MLRNGHNRVHTKRSANSAVFAALADETRLRLIGKLSIGRSSSIAQLTAGSKLTRQAITKHLRVLQNAGIVRCSRKGRESLFEFDPRPIEDIKDYLNVVSEQWDRALARLKSFVEE